MHHQVDQIIVNFTICHVSRMRNQVDQISVIN